MTDEMNMKKKDEKEVVVLPIKHYPMPDYCKCNAGHQLVEIFNEKKNCFDWDCPICIEKMRKANGVKELHEAEVEALVPNWRED